MGGLTPDSPLPTGSGRVLVVDDEVSITTMIQAILQDLGIGPLLPITVVRP